MRCLPQAQRLGDPVTEAQHRQIPSFPTQGKLRVPQLAAIGQFLYLATNPDIHRQRSIMAEPWVASHAASYPVPLADGPL